MNNYVKAVYGAEDFRVGDYTKHDYPNSSNARDPFKATKPGG